jgi:hypothetical protein
MQVAPTSKNCVYKCCPAAHHSILIISSQRLRFPIWKQIPRLTMVIIRVEPRPALRGIGGGRHHDRHHRCDFFIGGLSVRSLQQQVCDLRFNSLSSRGLLDAIGCKQINLGKHRVINIVLKHLRAKKQADLIVPRSQVKGKLHPSVFMQNPANALLKLPPRATVTIVVPVLNGKIWLPGYLISRDALNQRVAGPDLYFLYDQVGIGSVTIDALIGPSL